MGDGGNRTLPRHGVSGSLAVGTEFLKVVQCDLHSDVNYLNPIKKTRGY